MNTSRRKFLQISTLAAVGIPMAASGRSISGKDQKSDSGKKNTVLLNVKEYGASGDGSVNDTAALQLAIDRCHVFGGGEVIIPAGNYLTGALQLKSNVTLRLGKDAVLSGTPDFTDYPVMQVRWEGKWIQGHTGLIYSVDAKNIGIIGPGKIAGNHALGGRPTKEKTFRHPALIEFLNCSNIILEDFSTDYHLMWCIHPVLCENISVKNLIIRSTGGNGDGIDIDSCRNVLIDGCDIETGDDCIAIKSGRGMEGFVLKKTTENVQIRNCRFSDSIFACIGIGSETSGGIRNVTVEDCTFTNTRTHAIYIKSRVGRGAFVENLTFRNLKVSGMKGGFLRINQLGSGIQDPEPVPGDEGIPSFRNFSFSGIQISDASVLVDAVSIHPAKPLIGFELTNVKGTCSKGISLANTEKAILENIDVSGFEGPKLSIHNVSGKGLDKAEKVEFPVKIPETTVLPEQYRLK